MNRVPAGRRLLFRSYLVLAGGLVVIGIALDLGLAALKPGDDRVSATLAAGWLRHAESELRAADRDDWPRIATALGEDFGVGLAVLGRGDVVGQRAGDGLQELVDDTGQVWFYREAPALDAYLQLGPLPAIGENRLAKFIPPLFYLSILVLVGAWLWPLMRDLARISRAADDFANDYRRPIRVAGETRVLRELAHNLENMSARIQGLIRNQKELTSALSHEMRTPLARIKFAMAVIEDRSGAANELDSIQQDVAEIDTLIATMLDYARLDHPATELNWQRTPTQDWLDEALARADGLGKDIACINELDGYRVRMDPWLMNLALSNLLVNACRYAVSRVTVRLVGDPASITLIVDDDGPGIPEADRETVFEAFSRLDDSRSRHTGGHGLGLAIVMRVATLHGGTVRAERSPEGGARIALRWPQAPDPGSPAPLARE